MPPVLCLMKRRTALVVAYRLSTIRGEDIIYVMKYGRIVEQGTHEELSKGSGVYHELAELSGIAGK